MNLLHEVREELARCIAGIDHLNKLAHEWEPDYSSGADRRGWVLARDARDGARAALARLDALGDALGPLPEAVAYLYHDANTPQDAHPWLHSTMLLMAAERRPNLRGETPLHTAATLEAWGQRAALIGAVPQGWKLAPLEPTTAMVNATGAVEADMLRMVADDYRAMLAAAPQPQQEPT